LGFPLRQSRLEQQPEHFFLIGLDHVTTAPFATDSEAGTAGVTSGKCDRPQTRLSGLEQQAAVLKNPALHANRHELTSWPSATLQ